VGGATKFFKGKGTVTRKGREGGREECVTPRAAMGQGKNWAYWGVAGVSEWGSGGW
jgi:hypothetical protein